MYLYGTQHGCWPVAISQLSCLSCSCIAVQVHAKDGNPVRKHLPPGLNPKLLEQLEASFGTHPARAASPPVPAVAKRVQEGSTPKQPANRSTPAASTPAGDLCSLSIHCAASLCSNRAVNVAYKPIWCEGL